MPANEVLQTLQHVWKTLAPLQCPMALMGGLAVAVWKHPRLTRDVDILLAVEETNLDALIQTLKQADFKPKRQPPVLEVGGQRIVQFLYQLPKSFLDIQVDLLLAVGEYQQEALKRRQATQIAGFTIDIFVLSCEDLMLHKLLAGRILDKADTAALLRANRPALNLAYLQTWIEKLSLAKDWALVWEEAFPGERPTQE